MPYIIPNRHHERQNVETHIPSSTHRAPGANQTRFITECFIDELALAGGWNPLDWRIEMTKGLEDYQRVLHMLKDKAGYRTDLRRGEGMGVAIVAVAVRCCASHRFVGRASMQALIGRLAIDALGVARLQR